MFYGKREKEMEKVLSEIWNITQPILRAAVCGDAISDECREKLSPQTLKAVYKFTKKYNIAQIAAFALLNDERIEIDGEVEAAFKKSLFLAATLCEQMDYEYNRIGKAFDEEQIPYIPLKGTVLRKYYRESWMRTSSDTDILVKAEDIERAKKTLTEKLKYTLTGGTAHDISLSSPGNIHTEIHYELIETNRAAKSSKILLNVWESSAPLGNTYCYAMSDEMFYFYHIAHMAKHFENGGCGIRPFIDLWILNHRIDFEREKREKMLNEGGLLKFAKACEELSEVWFGSAKANEITQALERYLLNGGMYGTVENMVAVQKNQDGGRMQYIFHRLFLPFAQLKNIYPVLKKHKWLMPLMQVRRWIKMITSGRMNRTVWELRSLNENENENSEMNELLEKLGLNNKK